MKILSILSLILIQLNSYSHYNTDSLKSKRQEQKICFTENKGQVSDQFFNPRKDILYYGSTSTMNYYLRNNGISYQLNKIDSMVSDSMFTYNKSVADWHKIPAKTTIYRIDINWIGANINVDVSNDKRLQGFNNYILPVCPEGVNNVGAYTGVTYKNIYDHIDLHYYQKNGHLKYDYLVQAHADYKKIKMEVKGVNKIELQKNGSLILKTPLGDIIEEKPIVYQNGRQLDARWTVDHETISYEILDYDENYTLLIDPVVRLWGTYYGGSYDDFVFSTCTDLNKNVFIAGYTNSQSLIATVGSHQSVFGSPQTFAWNKDAFLVKFDSNGVRLWGTYYGDWNYEEGRGCTTDAIGDVYLSGMSGGGTTTVMATPGAFLTTPSIGFLAKFNTNGQRIWATYYAGKANKCTTDASNNVYIAGEALNGAYAIGVVATANAHQTVFAGVKDGFLAKFNSTGSRLWATYYGGSLWDHVTSCRTDIYKNVYISGYTDSNMGTAIATTSSHQSTLSGGNDAFLAKFDSMGVRQWGTYYGGPGFDWGYSTFTDLTGNVYLAGTASNGTVYTTSNSHQPSHGGGAYDGFLVKFNSMGIRQWATFYGGAADEDGMDGATDKYGNVYLCGATGSSTGIATSNGFQTIHGGNWDAYLVKFDSNGTRLWGSYYGGNFMDRSSSCALDATGNCYLTGLGLSSNNIASTGAFQDTLGGGNDSYLAKFSDCAVAFPPLNSTPLANQFVCSNTTATLSVTGIGFIQWYPTPTSTNVLGTGLTFTQTLTNPGNYTYYAEVSACTTNVTRTPVTLTVHPLPSISISGGSSICAGGSISQIANGSALTYTWSNGTFGNMVTLTPTVTSNLSVAGTDTNNCIGSTNKTIYLNPLPNLIASSSSSVICLGENTLLHVSGASMYNWSNGSLGSSIVISPSVTTTFSVIGVDQNGCSSSTSVTQIVSICNGFESLKGLDSEYFILPNPTTGNLIIILPATESYLELFNLNGQLLLSKELHSGRSSLDISHLPNGVYLIKIIDEGHKIVLKKIIKI